MKRNEFSRPRGIASVVALLFATTISATVRAQRTDGPGAAGPPAQSAVSVNPEAIRGRAQRLKEYRALLADRDANVRLATLDEMLKSSDTAVSELAYETGFASDEPTLRALALRSRLFSMKTIVLKLENSENLPAEQWQKVIKAFRGEQLVFKLSNPDPKTGTINVGRGSGYGPGQITSQEFNFSYGGQTVGLHLTDGGIMQGKIAGRRTTAPVTLTLQ